MICRRDRNNDTTVAVGADTDILAALRGVAGFVCRGCSACSVVTPDKTTLTTQQYTIFKKRKFQKKTAKYFRHNTPPTRNLKTGCDKPHSTLPTELPMYLKLPKSESDTRLARLFSALEITDASWDTALVFGRINLYYLTGTIQDGVLVLRRNGEVQFFVRRSYKRAREASPLDAIHPMKSYRDMQDFLPADLGRTFVEMDQVPVAVLDRLQKYFQLDVILPLDPVLRHLRAGKSPYELAFQRKTGRDHDHLLMEIVPEILREGMSEAQLFGELYRAMMNMDHQGLVRFAGFGTEMQIGQVGFGTTTLVPTCFDGPGGMMGASAGLPSVGGRDRTLAKGDMVFVDIGYGYCGYHTDKTQVYSFGGKLPQHALALHEECIAVQKKPPSFSRREIFRPKFMPMCLPASAPHLRRTSWDTTAAVFPSSVTVSVLW